MHFVSKVDGLDYVVVLDGLALSSWCLPDEVVSDVDLHASSDGQLSTDGEGRLVLAWDDQENRSHLLAVDTLERERRFSRNQLSPSVLGASGETLLRPVDSGVAPMLDRLDLELEQQGSRPFPFPEEEPVTLSADAFAPLWTRPRRVGRAGLVAVVDKEGRALLADFRDFDASRAVAFAKLWVPPSWDVRLTPFEDALGVIAHDVARGTATVWVVSGREVFEKKGLAALTMPTFATKDVLLTQVDAGTLRRVPLKGGEPMTLRLPASGGETGLEAHGPGTPIASADVTAFLPWHGESLIHFDVETGEPSEVSRLLPEGSREARRLIMRRVREANEAARDTGTRFELKALKLTPKHRRFDAWLTAHGGDGSLWARAVLGSLQFLNAELVGQVVGGWTLGMMGHPHLPDRSDSEARIGADEMVAVLGRIEHLRLPLASFAPIIERPYELRPAGSWNDGTATPPLMDDAAVLLLQAFLVGLSTEPPVSLPPRLALWRHTPMKVSEMAAYVPRLLPSHLRIHPMLPRVLARLASVHLHQRAGPLLEALVARATHPEHLLAQRAVTDMYRTWAARHRLQFSS